MKIERKLKFAGEGDDAGEEWARRRWRRSPEVEEIAGGKGWEKLGFLVRLGERKNEGESGFRVGKTCQLIRPKFGRISPTFIFF